MQKVIRRVVQKSTSTQLKGNTIMNTILNVTPAGLSNEEIDRLKSEVAKKAIYRTAIFSTSQSLINSAGKLQKFEAYMSRLTQDQQHSILESNRYIDTKDRANESAVRLACLDALQEAKGYALDVDLQPKPQRLPSASQLEAKAKFIEMNESELMKLEVANQTRMMQQASEGVNLATQMFFAADIEEYQPVYDENGKQAYETSEDETDFTRPVQTCSTRLVYFHPESVLKDLIRTRDFLITWANPDYAELGVLVQDIKTVEVALKKFNDITEYAGEESRTTDNLAASNEDLKQAIG